jgi:hypothetical protein
MHRILPPHRTLVSSPCRWTAAFPSAPPCLLPPNIYYIQSPEATTGRLRATNKELKGGLLALVMRRDDGSTGVVTSGLATEHGRNSGCAAQWQIDFS